MSQPGNPNDFWILAPYIQPAPSPNGHNLPSLASLNLPDRHGRTLLPEGSQPTPLVAGPVTLSPNQQNQVDVPVPAQMPTPATPEDHSQFHTHLSDGTPFTAHTATVRSYTGTADARAFHSMPVVRQIATRANLRSNAINGVDWGYRTSSAGYIVGVKAKIPCYHCRKNNGPYPECVTLPRYDS
ncbi:hypothetical protein DL98DRAFT_532239 [Cadophora sp. DSE1049]|nr:hypothetical protein DL98DRAFT_532239 [Cadophora sp. DSE1049]